MEAFAGFVIGVALTLFTLSKFGCIHVHLDIHTHDGDDDEGDFDDEVADPDVWPNGRRFVRRN